MNGARQAFSASTTTRKPLHRVGVATWFQNLPMVFFEGAQTTLQQYGLVTFLSCFCLFDLCINMNDAHSALLGCRKKIIEAQPPPSSVYVFEVDTITQKMMFYI